MISDSPETRGTEKDGLRRGRSGEGGNQKKLRLWVKRDEIGDQPSLIPEESA